jgi:hypothetical protein
VLGGVWILEAGRSSLRADELDQLDQCDWGIAASIAAQGRGEHAPDTDWSVFDGAHWGILGALSGTGAWLRGFNVALLCCTGGILGTRSTETGRDGTKNGSRWHRGHSTGLHRVPSTGGQTLPAKAPNRALVQHQSAAPRANRGRASQQ